MCIQKFGIIKFSFSIKILSKSLATIDPGDSWDKKQ